MRLGHARVGIKHVYDRFLKAVVTFIMYRWKIYTSCPFELQTWNPCLIYVDRDNPVSFVIECNVIAVKKRLKVKFEKFLWKPRALTKNVCLRCGLNSTPSLSLHTALA